MAVPETTESTASTAVDETNDGFGAALAPETPEVEVTVSSPCDASGGGYKQDGKGDGGGEAAAEVERLAKAIAGLRTADSMENLASLVPADTSGPDIFDRLGYGDSASEDEADGDAEGASRETDGASSSSSASSDEDDDDTVAPFAHAVRAVVSGVEPLDSAALGVLARALAVDLASTLADRDGPFESLEDAPRVISAAVDALPELALALTLAPPTPSRNVVARLPPPPDPTASPSSRRSPRCSAPASRRLTEPSRRGASPLLTPRKRNPRMPRRMPLRMPRRMPRVVPRMVPNPQTLFRR